MNKPIGPTSQNVVSQLKHIFTNSAIYKSSKQTKSRKKNFIKIGHGGTLDPQAEGVLVIGVGSGTKELSNYLGKCKKVYTARALLGASTTTYDGEGDVLEYGSSPQKITTERLQEVLNQFRGSITQLPPVFSALKMDGKPLYEYARSGIPLPRAIERRECEVSRLEAGELVGSQPLPQKLASKEDRAFARAVTGQDIPESTIPPEEGAYLDLTFSVSSGTYIRSLIHDIGEALGTKAHMVSLTRDLQGDWELGKNVLPLELFTAEPEEAWWPVLESVLAEGPKKITEEGLKTEATRDPPNSGPHLE